MQHFKTIAELIASYNTLAYPGRIFYELSQRDDYTKSQFWVMSSKEQKEEDSVEIDGDWIPESVAPYNVKSFMGVDTFQDIIEVKLSNNPDLSVKNDTDVFITAIHYYLANDDFMD